MFTHMRGRNKHVTHDITIAQMGNGVTECGWRHAPEAYRGFWEILKKSVGRVENWTLDEKGWLSLAYGGLGQVSQEMGGKWKSQNRKIVPLSPYVKKPLNSKVIHSRKHFIILLVYRPVGCGCRIHRLNFCRGVPLPPTSVLDMTLNNLMVRFQWCWGFGECGTPLHCHGSQVHSGLEWWHLIGPYLWVEYN